MLFFCPRPKILFKRKNCNIYISRRGAKPSKPEDDKCPRLKIILRTKKYKIKSSKGHSFEDTKLTVQGPELL